MDIINKCFTNYSLSITLFLIVILSGLGYWITLNGYYLQNSSWNFVCAYILNKFIIFAGVTIIVNYLIHKGSQKHIKYHEKTQEDLQKILYYLEIDK